MPLPIAHGLLGASFVAALHQKPGRIRYLLAGALLANAADVDFLLVASFQSKAWHRGFTHSIVFGLLISLLLLIIFRAWPLRNAIGYSLAFTSHGLLDYLTSKHGGGVALLWPFSNTKFTFGWWGLSEVPSRLTWTEILQTLALETVLFSLLFLAILLSRRSLAKSMSSTADVN